MFGLHSKKRRGLVLVAAIGSGLLWSGVGMPLPAHAQGPDAAMQLYVNNIYVGWVRGTGTKKKPRAIIDIVDGNGNPVNGALVVGDWSGCFKLNGLSDTTETVCSIPGFEPTGCVDGRAVILGKWHTCRGKNCLFSFTITDVRKAGMTYVPVDGKTSGGIWCDPFEATAARGTTGKWGDTPVQAQVVGTKMHVSSMGVSFYNVGGPRRQTIALVEIQDEFGNPVNDAVVTGNWSGCFKLNGASGTTQTWYYPDGTIFAIGRAQILGKVYSCWGNKTPHCFWVFTVTGVSKPGMTYDPTANFATWASLQCR